MQPNKYLRIMTSKKTKIVCFSITIILLILFIGPFLIPIPALKGVVSPDRLADPDSQFIQVNGLKVHYKIYGQGEPVMVLLHGFGASLFSWREVTESLSKLGTVIIYDRPAFGLTERPVNGDMVNENPYSNEYQDKLLVGLLDVLKINRAILIGNSAGGTVSVQTALNYPERVSELILVDAAIIDSGGYPQWISWIFKVPQVNRLGPLLMRNIKSWGLTLLSSAWHDPSRITQVIIDGYEKPLNVENWDQALWELVKSSKSINIIDKIADLKLPVLILSGDDDRIIPTRDSIKLQEGIANAELKIFKGCGHVPQEECPGEFLDSVISFVKRLN